MKRYANYSDIPVYLKTTTPFDGNTMWAEWRENKYNVYSYNAHIATYDPVADEWTTHEPHRGSNTTTRHQNIVERVINEVYSNVQ